MKSYYLSCDLKILKDEKALTDLFIIAYFKFSKKLKYLFYR